MTPFGRVLTDLRRVRKLSHDQLAAKLKMTPAELTSVMTGYRGFPSPVLIFQIEREMDLTRFELENLKAAGRVSNPEITFNLAGLEAEQIEFVNILAAYLRKIGPGHMHTMLEAVKKIIDKL
jgi:transcriptional regulator with XRE-family HTH domain